MSEILDAFGEDRSIAGLVARNMAKLHRQEALETALVRASLSSDRSDTRFEVNKALSRGPVIGNAPKRQEGPVFGSSFFVGADFGRPKTPRDVFLDHGASECRVPPDPRFMNTKGMSAEESDSRLRQYFPVPGVTHPQASRSLDRPSHQNFHPFLHPQEPSIEKNSLDQKSLTESQKKAEFKQE